MQMLFVEELFPEGYSSNTPSATGVIEMRDSIAPQFLAIHEFHGLIFSQLQGLFDLVNENSKFVKPNFQFLCITV
jgi:hypothetical protein